MKNFTTIFLSLFLFLSASSQSIPTYCVTFGSGQGEGNLCGVATFDGGYVIGGFSFYGGNAQNSYIAKYDGNGNITWSHDVGSGSTNDIYSVTETSDHHILVAAYLGGSMVVIKYTADGVQVWAKSISVLSITYGYSIIETSDGNILISGTSNDFSNFYTVVVKLDSDGNLLWNKNFNVDFDTADEGHSCIETADHHYIIEIYGASLNDFFYVLALDTGGNQLWSKQSANSGVVDGLIATADSGVVVAGYTCLTTNCDALLNKFDKNGNVLWSYTYGDSLFDRFYAVAQTSDGGFAIAGKATDQLYNYHGFVVKTDANGQLQWSKITDDGELRSIDNSNDGGLITSSTRFGSLKIGVMKLDEEGNSCCNLTDYGAQHSGTSFSDVTVSSHIAAATITDATMNEIIFEPIVTTSCTQVGIEETIENFHFDIYPNPADQFAGCNWQVANKENASLKIFDATGRQIFKSEIRDSKAVIIKVSDWRNGIYFCELQSDNHIAASKFIVQHPNQ